MMIYTYGAISDPFAALYPIAILNTAIKAIMFQKIWIQAT